MEKVPQIHLSKHSTSSKRLKGSKRGNAVDLQSNKQSSFSSTLSSFQSHQSSKLTRHGHNYYGQALKLLKREQKLGAIEARTMQDCASSYGKRQLNANLNYYDHVKDNVEISSVIHAPHFVQHSRSVQPQVIQWLPAQLGPVHQPPARPVSPQNYAPPQQVLIRHQSAINLHSNMHYHPIAGGHRVYPQNPSSQFNTHMQGHSNYQFPPQPFSQLRVYHQNEEEQRRVAFTFRKEGNMHPNTVIIHQQPHKVGSFSTQMGNGIGRISSKPCLNPHRLNSPLFLYIGEFEKRLPEWQTLLDSKLERVEQERKEQLMGELLDIKDNNAEEGMKCLRDIDEILGRFGSGVGQQAGKGKGKRMQRTKLWSKSGIQLM